MKPSGIGGQAVMEGVMMKNGDAYAVAVRLPNGEITVKKEEYKCICKEFKEQIADPEFEGYCHCMLYYKSKD